MTDETWIHYTPTKERMRTACGARSESLKVSADVDAVNCGRCLRSRTYQVRRDAVAIALAGTALESAKEDFREIQRISEQDCDHVSEITQDVYNQAVFAINRIDAVIQRIAPWESSS